MQVQLGTIGVELSAFTAAVKPAAIFVFTVCLSVFAIDQSGCSILFSCGITQLYLHPGTLHQMVFIDLFHFSLPFSYFLQGT